MAPGEILVASYAEFAAALAAPAAAPVNIVLAAGSEFALTTSLEIPAGKNVTIRSSDESAGGRRLAVSDLRVVISTQGKQVFHVEDGGVLYLSGVHITSNGMAMDNGAPASGGGIRVDAGGIATLDNVEISNSGAASGGGFYVDGGDLVLDGCEIHDCNSLATGGGASFSKKV